LFAYPSQFSPDQAAWAKVLDEIGFRHIIFHEFPLPAFPPSFSRPEQHLKDAWRYHRAGDDNSALNSCYLAFECLGFNVSRNEIGRKKVLDLRMEGKEDSKKQTIEKMWASLSGFTHLGRHERSEPVHISHKDGELAVVSTTVLLSYFAGPESED
jgi:hypothetical protein